jgi:hypothetical protein
MRQIESQIARGTQPLEVTRKQFVKALTRPMDEVLKTAQGEHGDIPFMDEASAKTRIRPVRPAQVHEPAWMFGAGKFEDVFRRGSGSSARTLRRRSRCCGVIARLPNELVKFRNRYRFQLDPMFSMRRVVKSGVEGVAGGCAVDGASVLPHGEGGNARP